MQAALARGIRVIASAHWPNAQRPPSRSTLLQCALAGVGAGGSAVKLVVAAATPAAAQRALEDAAVLRAAHLRGVGAGGRDVPLVFLAMGQAGKVTRALNPWFTPVTHPALPLAAAPGQLSARAVAALRSALGIVTPRTFYLFGAPLAQSLSPAMHNTAFGALGLPHSYCLAETASVGEVARILLEGGAASAAQLVVPVHGSGEGVESPAPVGYAAGANVTMPLKVDVLPLCSAISPEAAAVGAVNVLLALPPRVPGERPFLYGANTDWLGIAWPIAQRLRGGSSSSSSSSTTAPQCALVIGAGGTARAAAYACRRLGLQLRVHNPRTPGKGLALAAEFGGVGLASLEAPLPRVRVVINTLPAALQWLPPPGLLGAGTLAMDVAYLPRRTPFLAAAAGAGCEEAVEGIEMLLAQGVASLALWLGVAGGAWGGAGAAAPAGRGRPASGRDGARSLQRAGAG
jgi:pentafunctional AROM polypeptide